MLAFGLSILLFLFWGVVGWAFLSALHTRRNLIQKMLLAPVVGVSVVVLLTFSISRAGLPIREFGSLLAVALFVLSAGLIRKFDARLPWRHYLPFGGVFLLALFLTGRPMLEFGFNWVSYANDDMANYVLGAHRFLGHGYYDVPSEIALFELRDASQYYWFMHAVGGVRSGSELLLAWLLSLTGLNGHQAFMPLILALDLVLVSATGGLVGHLPRHRSAALLTCLLVSFSALNSLGVLQQLIAQVFGLGLLSGTLALLLSLPKSKRLDWKSLAGHCLVSAILVAATLIVYPEVLPFLAFAFAILLFIQTFRRQSSLKATLPSLTLLSAFCLIFVNTHIPRIIEFFVLQSHGGLKHADLESSLFPFFLVPSGLANLSGILPIGGSLPSDAWLSMAIAAGGIFLLVAALAAICQTFRGEPVAAICLVMLGLAIYLFFNQGDFGLYKLAMYLQPFVLGTLAVHWISIVRRIV